MEENPWVERREEYASSALTESQLAPDPLTMFRRWYDDAARSSSLPEPNAMVVATASPEGQPSSRMVLLKGIDERGFVFFTNLRSRKGQELAGNPRCSLLFPWHPLQRQVRVEGGAEELAREEVAAYFATRPRGAQVGAWASAQSSVVTAAELAEQYAAAEARMPDHVPVPDHWGGFAVVPEVVEFWQGRANRMHDRWRYRLAKAGAGDAAGDGTDDGANDGAGAWVVERLGP